MKIRTGMVTLFAPLALAAVMLPASLGGCQDEGGGGGGGNTTPTASQTGTGGTGLTGGGGTGATGGNGQGGDQTCGYGAIEATIEQITDPGHASAIGEGIAVNLTGVVAMSHKFKVSGPGSSGNCLWGVFVSSPGLSTTQAYSGILALSYGTPAAVPDGGTTAYCPVPETGEPAGDAFPDDTQPGDVLDLSGWTDSYVPSVAECAGVVPQLQLAGVCSAVRTSTGATLPEPANLDAQIDLLGSPSDAAFHAQWGGVKVQITNVTADGVEEGDCGAGNETIVGDYGVIVLNEGNNLHLANKLIYQGLLNAWGWTCYSGPNRCTPTGTPYDFTRIDGFSYLNFCDWSIEPRHKCDDIAPDDGDCPCTSSD